MNFDTIHPHRINKPEPSPKLNQVKLPIDIIQKLGIQ